MAKKLQLDFEGGQLLDFVPNPAFEGEAGHKLLQLQQDYGSDPRFRLTPEFTKGLKQEETLQSEPDEKEKLRQILGEIVPSAARYKRDVRPMQIQRFDPIRPNPDLVVSPPAPQKRPRDESIPKPLPSPPKKKKDKRKKRKESKEKRKKKQTEQLQDGEFRKKAPRRSVEAKVEVKADLFKPTKEQSGFRLFS